MAESTLSLKYADLAGEVGAFLGFGRGADNGDQAWSASQASAVESCVRSGVRRFYFPPPVEGQESSYDWSFLKPLATLTFAKGASTLALPDDLGGIEGEITIASTTSQVSWPIPLVGEGRVREKYAELPTATGRPILAALQPLRATTATAGQRFQLFLWPLADQAYTLQFAYYVAPDRLDGAFPFPLGGMAHAETVLESCLAVAEQRLDDAATVHTAAFNERLAASINLDRRLKAQTLGYNGDRSDLRDRRWGPRSHYWDQLTTVYGVQH